MGLPLERSSGLSAQSTRAPISCGTLFALVWQAHAFRPHKPHAHRRRLPLQATLLCHASSSGMLVKQSSSSGGGTWWGSRLHAVLVTAACPCGRRLALRDLRHDDICQQEGLGHGHGILQSAAHHLMEAMGPGQGDRSAGVTAAASMQAGRAWRQTQRSPPKYTHRVAKQGLHQ